MWKELQRGTKPPEHVSEELYKDVKQHKTLKYPAWLVGYVGFHATFGAKYFNGYARDRKTGRDMSNEAYKNTMKQLPNLLDVEFVCGDYREVSLNDRSVIYCDIPYEGTTSYDTEPFIYDDFYIWCQDMADRGHIIFVSSYYLPEDIFTEVWRKEVITNFSSQKIDYDDKKRIEKLYKYENKRYKE